MTHLVCSIHAQREVRDDSLIVVRRIDTKAKPALLGLPNDRKLQARLLRHEERSVLDKNAAGG
eukprot:COSAG03_NODE_3124_length_2197_cov_1420.287893_3_plen_63_part_00